MLQTLFNTLLAPMAFERTRYRKYGIEHDHDSAGVCFWRIRTPLAEPCGYAVSTRAAVAMIRRVLEQQKRTGYLPSALAMYEAGDPPRLAATYFNPERSNRDEPQQE